jgi:hypothetical protein
MFRRQLEAKVLASCAVIGCNAESLNFRSAFKMHVKRRRLPNFESCSVALFTSLALGGAALPARSQAPATPSSISSTPSTVRSTTAAVPSTPRRGMAGSRSGPTPADGSRAAPPYQQVSEQLAQSFKRADLDSDGQLSRQETSGWPAVTRGFDQIDSNKDGSISSAEFDEALK